MKSRMLFLLLIPIVGMAQEKRKLDPESGYFQLGVRNTVSAFSDDGAHGFGYGGQFRIRISKRMNTDWFADYITTDIGGIARRVDEHIGWSVVDVLEWVVLFLVGVWAVSGGDVVRGWVVEVLWFLVLEVPSSARAAPAAKTPFVVEVDPFACLALGKRRKVPVSSVVEPLAFRVVRDVTGLREDELENSVVDIRERHIHGLNCMETMSPKRISRKTINFNKKCQKNEKK